MNIRIIYQKLIKINTNNYQINTHNQENNIVYHYSKLVNYKNKFKLKINKIHYIKIK